MTQMRRLNRDALDYYLRGEGGELARREAEQELWERGQRSVTMTEEKMVEELKARGYVVFKPRR